MDQYKTATVHLGGEAARLLPRRRAVAAAAGAGGGRRGDPPKRGGVSPRHHSEWGLPAAGDSKVIGSARVEAISVTGGAPFYRVTRA